MDVCSSFSSLARMIATMHTTDKRCLVEAVFALTAVTAFLMHRVSRGLGSMTCLICFGDSEK